MANLPPGFQLEQSQERPQGLPQGFQLEQPKTQQQDPRMLLQDLLVLQSKGVQGLEQPISQLRQVTGDISDPAISRSQPQEFTAGEQALGLGEAVLSKATGVLGSIPAGIVGLADAANPFAEEGAGGERVKQIQEALTFQPRTEAGKAELRSDILQPVGEALEEFRGTLGDDTLQATGSPFLASISHVLPDATLALFGVRAGPRGTGQQLNQAQATKQLSQQFSKNMSKSDQAIAQLLIDKADDVSTATKKLSTENLKAKLTDGLPRIVNDKLAQNAIKRGASEKAVAIIKAMNKTEKARVRQMLGTAEKALKSGTAEALNRVSDTVGKTLVDRLKAVDKLNKQAGANVDKVAKSRLTGKTVDNASVLDKFNQGLGKMKVSRDGNTLRFEGSSLETGVSGASSARNILKLMQKRINAAGGDALKLHELKRFIDDQVKFGKTPSGAPGAAESTLKSVRAEINKVLGDNFPKYREINSKFASTKEVLDNFQKAAGPSVNISDELAAKGLGTKLRTLTSNNAGRAKMLKAMSDLEDVLVSNGIQFKDRIVQQSLIANELERLLKLDPKTGFKSQVAEGVLDATTGQPVMATARTAKTIADKVRGQTPEKALEALKELLKEAN